MGITMMEGVARHDRARSEDVLEEWPHANADQEKERLRMVVCCRFVFFFSSRRRHTRFDCDWSSDVCSSDLFWPHTYGVSFFSSRGPTGDGRAKPDLVAPGEKIRAPVPGNHNEGGNWGDLDGTSMAAPHVSGAAAMLMARYQELIGQPDRIKSILCQSATDLGRERSFQGHGMLDVLRAFQSI